MTPAPLPPPLKEVRYGPESQLTSLPSLFGRMLADLHAARELGYRLARRNISATYRQSVLGLLWAFAPPVFTALVFIGLRKGGAVTANTEVPYAAWVLSGVFMWQVLADAVTAQLRSFNQAKQMLAKINFPRESVVLAGIGETLFAFGIRMILLIPLLVWLGVGPGLALVWLPVGMLAILLLGTVAGVVLGPISLIMQDIEKGVPLILPLLMIVSGVVIPLPDKGALAVMDRWNPLALAVNCCRDAILGTPVETGPACLLLVLILGVLALFGWILFRVALPHAVARIPA